MRYWNGVRLLQEGYAPHLLLDVFSRGYTFGHSDIELAQDMLNQMTPGQSRICPIGRNSTYEGAEYLAYCLEEMHVKSVLLITSDFHTRRALSILRKRLPQYHFSNDNAHHPYSFGERWWTKRQWRRQSWGNGNATSGGISWTGGTAALCCGSRAVKVHPPSHGLLMSPRVRR